MDLNRKRGAENIIGETQHDLRLPAARWQMEKGTIEDDACRPGHLGHQRGWFIGPIAGQEDRRWPADRPHVVADGRPPHWRENLVDDPRLVAVDGGVPGRDERSANSS